jgi:choloylglycine hydrolase
LVIGLLTIALGPQVEACSTFLIRHNGTVLVGHNLDEPGIGVWPGMVVVNKRGIPKQARTWRDVGSNTIATGRMRWVSKYGSITTNGFGRELPDGGMNEAGLVVCEMTLAETQFVEDESLPKMFMMQWVQYLLDTCGSVEEVIHSAKNISLDGWNWHFFVADAKGEAAVIEFIEAKPVIITGKSLPVLALCNSRYQEELGLLKEYAGFGGEKPISLTGDDAVTQLVAKGIGYLLGTKPNSSADRDLRFVHAAHMLNEYDPDTSARVQAFSILKQMNKNGFSKWSIVYDIKNGRIDFHTSAAPKLRYCTMQSFDFSEKGLPLSADINAVASGDIHSLFRPCTKERNRAFVKKTVDAILKLHGGESIELGTKGNVQEFTPQQFLDRLATFYESVTHEVEDPK